MRLPTAVDQRTGQEHQPPYTSGQGPSDDSRGSTHVDVEHIGPGSVHGTEGGLLSGGVHDGDWSEILARFRLPEHIPGAINIPRREFEARQSEVPQDALVLPYCNMDFRGFVAVRQLEAMGFERVGLMQERGIQGWKAKILQNTAADGYNYSTLQSFLDLADNSSGGLE